MNLNLCYEGFESNLIARKPLYDGVQYVFRFANGYGASVVKHFGSYGHDSDLWELAVIHFVGEIEWDLVYNTDITSDVEGFLSDEDVINLLNRIKYLSNDGREEKP